MLSGFPLLVVAWLGLGDWTLAIPPPPPPLPRTREHVVRLELPAFMAMDPVQHQSAANELATLFARLPLSKEEDLESAGGHALHPPPPPPRPRPASTGSEEKVSPFLLEKELAQALMDRIKEGDVSGADAILKLGIRPGYMSLHHAVKICPRGNSALVRLLLDHGADVNAYDDQQHTPIAYAIADPGLVGLLARYGADLSLKQGPLDYSLLHLAVQYANPVFVKLWCELAPAQVRVSDCQGNTPLHVAASLGALDIAKTLLHVGNADPFQANDAGMTPFHYAISKKQIVLAMEMVLAAKLLGYAQIPTTIGQDALRLALVQRDASMLQWVLSFGVDLTETQVQRQLLAPDAAQQTEFNHRLIEIYRQHVESKLANTRNMIQPFLPGTSLMSAAHPFASFAAPQLTETLRSSSNLASASTAYSGTSGDGLSRGMMIAGDTNTVVGSGDAFRSVGSMESVGSSMPVVSQQTLDETFRYAASQGVNIAYLLPMLSKGAKLQSLDHQGNTALHLAAAHGHLETVRFLIREGADADVWNHQSELPVHLALNGGHVGVVQFFVRTHGQDKKLIWSNYHLAYAQLILRGTENPWDNDSPSEYRKLVLPYPHSLFGVKNVLEAHKVYRPSKLSPLLAGDPDDMLPAFPGLYMVETKLGEMTMLYLPSQVLDRIEVGTHVLFQVSSTEMDAGVVRQILPTADAETTFRTLSMRPRKIYRALHSTELASWIRKRELETRIFHAVSSIVQTVEPGLEVLGVHYQWDRRKLLIFVRQTSVYYPFSSILRKISITLKLNAQAQLVPIGTESPQA